MRDGIVNVEDVQIEVACDLSHFRGQGQGIRRKLEQRIGRCVDTVKHEISLVTIKSKRQRVGDEVYLVASHRQLLAEFSGDNPRSTCHRITRDTNIHLILIL